MKKGMFLLLLIIFAKQSDAKKVKGYFVTHDKDTTNVTFKIPYRLTGINLMKISDSLSYFSKDGKRLFSLYPKDVVSVKIFNKNLEDYDIFPFNNSFVQRTIKGTMSCYKTDYKGEVPSMEFGSVRARITVYYLELKSGIRRSFEIQGGYQIMHKNFWIDFLNKDYPEFIDCLTWDRSERKENRKLGLGCPLKTMDFEEVIYLFNKTYD